MNSDKTFKIQNVRSVNLSNKTRTKINALTHESDDVIFIINCQIGKNKSTAKMDHTQLILTKTKTTILNTLRHF